jgi:hypothetical protein
MTKEEKRNVIIAVVLAIAAVVVIWWLMQQNNTAPAQTTAPALTPDLGATPTYTNYNVPAYTPDLGDIIPPAQRTAWGQPGPECGCNGTVACGNEQLGMVTTVDQFNAMMGSYNP